MYASQTSPKRVISPRMARGARDRAHRSPARATRALRATDAAMPVAHMERRLRHPIGGLEGYTPAEVKAAQMRMV
jgi:hypothetical protein